MVFFRRSLDFSVPFSITSFVYGMSITITPRFNQGETRCWSKARTRLARRAWSYFSKYLAGDSVFPFELFNCIVR